MKRSLRIATMIASQYALPIPEEVIHAPIDLAVRLADEMKRRGHETTFYAPPSTGFAHPVVSGRLDRPLQGDPILEREKEREREKIYMLADQYLLSLLYRDAADGRYDVAHVHPIDRGLPFADLAPIPTVYTLHDPIYPWRAEMFGLYAGGNRHIVSISEAQRAGAPELPYARNVYNGVDVEKYAFSASPEDRFAFVGRLLAKKGVKEAIEAAKRADAMLDVVGRPFAEDSFWKEQAEPLLDDRRRHLLVDRKDLPAVYQRAKALLFPIKWDEPFGLVMIEAMACGTPVIAFDRGSVREVVEDGVTGFIVKDVDEMVEAMKRIGEIDRRACRARVEEKFSFSRMADGYENLYLELAKS